MIEREDGIAYIATISGGKDSVTMCDLLLKNGYPVDYIVFNDTLDEFEEMYEYIYKVENYMIERYGIQGFVRLKPVKTYDEYIFNVRSRGENIGKIMGLPNPSLVFCEWRRDAKIIPMQNWIKNVGIEDYYVYLGFTTDEKHRVNGNFNLVNNGKPIYPLIDYFNMSERNCQEYLINQEMENPLYRHFSRTGCKKCQYQSERDFYNIWKHYPKVWNEIKDLEKRVQEYPQELVCSSHFFINFQTAEDMEKKFIKKDRQGSLFDFSDEPLKDCFCKI